MPLDERAEELLARYPDQLDEEELAEQIFSEIHSIFVSTFLSTIF